jgi:exopolyphosphatase/guanosine-5'-triphosphate,3'-diphosphate pyrophosphatase
LQSLTEQQPVEQALALTDDAMASFATDIAAANVDAVSVVATSVARRFDDLAPLQALCQRHFAQDLHVLSGPEEARLGWVGATSGRSLDGPAVVLDIGSGSTEVAFGDPSDTDPPSTVSLPIGARTVTADYLHQDPPGPDELSAALSVIELHYDDIKRESPQILPLLDDATVLGVGAVCHVARVEIGLTDAAASVDGHSLTKAEVEEVFRALATETAEDRAYNPGLDPGHVVDIVGGLCVLVEFLRRFGVGELTVSERDLRHGRARELLSAGGLVGTDPNRPGD